MIRRITAIKNLGIFNNYEEKEDLAAFERFNLIYGWNGSGKTTLSEFFEVLKSGHLDRFSKLKYNIIAEDQEGVCKKYSHDVHYLKNIKVFNQEYIKNNINIVAGTANSIRMIVGEENKKLIEQIDEDKKILERRDVEIKKNESKISQKEKERNEKFTNVARIISAIGGGYASRNYNRPSAIEDFNKLEMKEILSQKEFDKNNTILNEQQKKELPLLNIGEFTTQKLLGVIEKSEKILSGTVEIAMVERINKDKDISKWVEDGLNLHQKSKSKFCEFCGQPLPERLIKQLLGHFNDEYKKIKNDIDVLLRDIDSIISDIKNIEIPDEIYLYDDMKKEYWAAKKKINSSEIFLLEDIKVLRRKIEDKKQCTTKSLQLSIDVCPDQFILSIDAFNVLIKKCNNITSNFNKEKNIAKKRLTNHYLSGIYDDVKVIDEAIKNTNAEIGSLKSGGPKVPGGDVAIDDIRRRFFENKNKRSNITKACVELNEALKEFLGRGELIFSPRGHEYLITRKGNPAKNLSEGEKTAIAFVYFTIHLKEEGFIIEDSIVVIDDPISSLDYNSMIYAFAFLKNAIKGAHQSFIFTHNIYFLQLILRWLKYERRGGKKYYMIKNPYHKGDRMAILDELDESLVNYDNEYQYLLELLRNLKGETVDSVYHIPNAARKVLEYFLMFMAPGGGGMHARMEKIKFDNIKKTAIYSFFNKESHMSGGEVDPYFVEECKTHVKYLLEMIDTTLQGGVSNN